MIRRRDSMWWWLPAHYWAERREKWLKASRAREGARRRLK